MLPVLRRSALALALATGTGLVVSAIADAPAASAAPVIMTEPGGATGFAAAAEPAAADPPRTIVSLTFDDGNANNLIAVDLLNDHDMDGTFYVPSGYLGAPGYLTRTDVEAIAAQGNEIGGHTVSHVDLAAVSPEEAARQVCQDRAQLASMGLTVRSFAYPFASYDDAVAATVRDCGYNSARSLGDLEMSSQRGAVYAESVPPQDPYAVRALSQVETSWTLADLQGAVTRAEGVGGWVTFTFHNVCEAEAACEISVTPSVLDQFLDWLAPRAANGTVVRTVGDTVGGSAKPIVAGPSSDPVGPDENGIVNGGFEELGPDGLPRCWIQGGYGDNARSLSLTNQAHSGGSAARAVVSGHVYGDARWMPRLDLGDCSSQVETGERYALGAWYTSDAVTQFAVYTRSESGTWSYWTSSPWFSPAASYERAAWMTPQVPAGVTGLSFGLSLFSNGTLTVDDIEIRKAVVAPVEPIGPGVNGIVNGGVETLGGTGSPSCWTRGGYGTHTALLSVTSQAHSGGSAVRAEVSDHVSGDARWMPALDEGGCAPSVAAGHEYSLRAWYTSDIPTQFAVYTRSAGGVWSYWTSSPWFGAADAYEQAVWTTPAVPEGVTGMSFGLSAFSNGALTVDDVEIYDVVGAPET